MRARTPRFFSIFRLREEFYGSDQRAKLTMTSLSALWHPAYTYRSSAASANTLPLPTLNRWLSAGILPFFSLVSESAVCKKSGVTGSR